MAPKKPKDTPTLPILTALNNALGTIRTHHPDIPEVVLVVGNQGHTARMITHGYFAPASWAAGEERTHEISLSGESLKRGAEETLGTLLHECAHALAAARKIQDTSRQGRFHNKRFKLLAEEVGIVVERDARIGWSITTLPKDTATLYRPHLTELRRVLKTYRVPKIAPPRPPSTIKLETLSGRTLTVPIGFYAAGDVRDDETLEIFEPIEITPELAAALERAGRSVYIGEQ